MRSALILFIAALVAACQPAAAPHPVIVSHVSAFNAGDVAAMGRLEHPDIEWFSVENASLSIEVSGRDELASMMTDYMLANPTVTGTLRDWSINGDFISVTETASWMTDTGEKQSQSALSVYQMEGDLIRRVWYYPALRH
jgi:hypothetical protein